jgi:hypothetical protein
MIYLLEIRLIHSLKFFVRDWSIPTQIHRVHAQRYDEEPAKAVQPPRIAVGVISAVELIR